jgi:hypothetical protein
MILDDTAARVVEMRRVLAEVLPAFAVVAFDNAPDCIEWLPVGLVDAALLCLDHDLGPTREPRPGSPPDERFDPGIGRDVADVLPAGLPGDRAQLQLAGGAGDAARAE